MRVALCLYGFSRTFGQTYQSYIDYVINKLNGDIFIFIPNTKNLDDNTALNIDHFKTIFKDKLIKCELFTHDIEFFKNIVKENNLPEKVSWTWWQNETYKSFSMFYQIKNVLAFKEEHEINNNFKYDAVLLSRPDMRIVEKIDLNIDLNKVYFTGDHCPPIIGLEPQQFISDHLLLTNSDNMSLLKEIFDKIPEYHREGILINNETLIGFHFIKNGKEIVKQAFTHHLLTR
jgi:hypothetical protein